MSRRAVAPLGTLLAALACHSARPAAEPAADACSAPAGELARAASAAGLAGEYQVRLTATHGPRSGAVARGRLLLQPRQDSLQLAEPLPGVRDTTTRYPLAGSLDIDPAALGAAATGDLGSADALAPGVLVIERHPLAADRPASIMLRLGAEANRRGRARFDGGYFALTVRRLDPDRFAGSWSSGTATHPAAARATARTGHVDACLHRRSPGADVAGCRRRHRVISGLRTADPP